MINSKETLYRFHKELNQPFESPDGLVTHALGILARHFKLERAGFYILNSRESVLSLKTLWAHGACIEAEEYIDSSESSPFYQVAERGRMLASGNAVFMPLKWGTGPDNATPGEVARNKRSGVLKLQRSKKAFTKREKDLAVSLAGELAHNLYQSELDQISREQLGRLSALTELTGIFASSLRVRDGIRRIMQSVQQYFGFDRVRLYLVDKQAQKLKGELSADIRGQVRSLEYEEIPLQPGSHRFADIILGKNTDGFLDKYRDSVLYLPLTVQGKSTGLLIVDNLLSQQEITREDLMLMKSFAGQIALAVDNARLFDEVQELSLYDELTKLPLRRYFTERLQEEFYRADRFKQPMALIWMDVDYFKEVNDTYGHQIGDKVLKEISRVVMANLRKIDFPCRYGGDEILIVLPQARVDDAKAIAKRLMEETFNIRIPVPFSKAGEVRVSVSQGIATFPDDADSIESLLQRADEALYWVKSNGKGKFAVYGEVLK